MHKIMLQLVELPWIALDWVISFFTRESSYCFSASYPSQFCLSVCLSVTRVDQSRTLQARIIKSSLSAAWKTLFLETVKLFHKFDGGPFKRDFDGTSLDFLGSRKPAQEGIKERYPHKSGYFTVVGQSFMKTVADKYRHAVYHNKH